MLTSQFKALVGMLQTQLRTIQEAIENQERAQRESCKTADAQWNKVPGIITSALRPTHNEITNAQARYDQAYRQQERSIKIQSGLKRATWCAFVGACVYAAVAGWQGCTARQQLRMDQRPWLKMSIPSFQRSYKAGDVLSIPVSISNYGKTPAERVIAGVVMQLVASGREPYIRPGGICKPGCKPPLWKRLWFLMPWVHRPNDIPVNGLINPIIYPQDSEPGEVKLLDTNRFDQSTPVSRKLTIDEVQALANDREYIAIYGTVWYFDVFGTEHSTTFCVSKYPDGSRPNSETCGDYGGVDNNY